MKNDKENGLLCCLLDNLQKEGLKVQLSDEHEKAGMDSGQTVVNCKVITLQLLSYPNKW